MVKDVEGPKNDPRDVARQIAVRIARLRATFRQFGDRTISASTAAEPPALQRQLC
jgi:hypothetical protein